MTTMTQDNGNSGVPLTSSTGLASPRPNPRTGTRSAPGTGRRRGRTYYTADWHLGHRRIIELCDRPFRVGGEPDVEAMNQAILDGVNRVAGPRDHLVIVGDIVMGKLDETLGLLTQVRAGRVTMLPGNHDRWSLAYPHKLGSGVGVQYGAGTGIPVRTAWKKRYEEQRRGIYCLADKEPSVWDAWTVGGSGLMNAQISHYPYRGDSRTGEGVEDRHRWLRPVDGGAPLIHGHVHTRWRISDDLGGRMFNVGVDVNDFAPVSEETLAMWVMDVRDAEREREWAQRRLG